ncbi:MAG: RNA polymerase sigma factor [Lachnospiraceae bacterium]|jgi:RNA polymerase sigma-70 factor (ECF subfamily)
MTERADEKIQQVLLEHYDKYYRLAYSYVGNQADALDIVQESAYKAIRDSGKVENENYISTWIYRIVVNTAIDMLRKRKKEGMNTQIEDYEMPVEDSYSDPDLAVALSRLKEEERLVITLRYFEELSLEEISDITGEPLSTIKSRLYRTLKKLRVDLEEGAFAGV